MNEINLNKLIKELKPIQYLIIIHYYGLCGFDKMTISSVMRMIKEENILDIPKSNGRNIKRTGLIKLRTILNKKNIAIEELTNNLLFISDLNHTFHNRESRLKNQKALREKTRTYKYDDKVKKMKEQDNSDSEIRTTLGLNKRSYSSIIQRLNLEMHGKLTLEQFEDKWKKLK